MSKILIVEDDAGVAQLLTRLLLAERHHVETISDGAEALATLRTSKFDLVILDLTLPHLDGIELCRQYRARNGDLPILMLTARGDGDDRAYGLDAGADDYLVKPFHLKELIARVRALLRRPFTVRRTDVISTATLQVNLRNHQVQWRGQTITLNPKEFDIIAFLARHAGEAYSAEQILERVWTSENEIQTVTVRSHIKNIRKKFAKISEHEFIHHIPGLGYIFEDRGC